MLSYVSRGGVWQNMVADMVVDMLAEVVAVADIMAIFWGQRVRQSKIGGRKHWRSGRKHWQNRTRLQNQWQNEAAGQNDVLLVLRAHMHIYIYIYLYIFCT